MGAPDLAVLVLWDGGVYAVRPVGVMAIEIGGFGCWLGGCASRLRTGDGSHGKRR